MRVGLTVGRLVSGGGWRVCSVRVLLAAAIRAVDELGYSDTSVADITTRAGVL